MLHRVASKIETRSSGSGSCVPTENWKARQDFILADGYIVAIFVYLVSQGSVAVRCWRSSKHCSRV